MGEHDALLKRLQPVLRYDSNEQFFADSAVQYMVTPGCQLRRERPDRATAPSSPAAANPGEPELTLDFLGPETYANGSTSSRATYSASAAGTTASST